MDFRRDLANYVSLLDESRDMIPFASIETLVALHVTICSTIDIIEYLIHDMGFAYVLTGKITQDCLEVKIYCYKSVYQF